MKKCIAVAVLMLGASLLVGCDSAASSGVSGTSAKHCTEPENPYSEGTGHYAGYEWASTHGEECSATSSSFQEGCDEYDAQEDEYEACTKGNQ